MTLARRAALLALLALAACPCLAEEDTLEPEACAVAGEVGAEDGEEAELMRVSLLQGPVRLEHSSGPRAALLAEPARQAAEKFHAAVDATGSLVEAAAKPAPPALAEREAVRHAGNGTGAAAAERNTTQVVVPASVAEEPDDGLQAAPSLVQTDLELQAGVLANASLEVPLEEHQPGDPVTGCWPGLTTVSTHIQLETLRAVGYLPERKHCLPESSQALALLEVAHGKPLEGVSTLLLEKLLIGGYGLFYLVCVSFMYYKMVYPSPLGDRKVQYHLGRKIVTDIDVEEETWRSSWTGWLACSWASSWVAKWGHSLDAALTKIQADDLPQLGTREYQARECSGIFKQLWREEVERKGEEQASVFSVVFSIWTKGLMLTLMLAVGIQQVLGQLYAVTLVEKGLNYFVWLQQEREKNPGKEISLLVPILCVIGLFSALPFTNVLLSSISNNIARRMDQKLIGALCLAIFEKAQRLPSSSLHPTISINKDTGKEEEKPAEVDMMQLVTYDVNGNLMACYIQICYFVHCILASIVFTNLLWARLKLATLFAFLVAIPFVAVLAFIADRLAGHSYNLQTVSDQRTRIVRELLWGMKVVKSYAWEDASEQRIHEYRKKEMGILETYFYYIGAIMGLSFVFPRYMIITALWAYCEMYGTHEVANIFVCIMLLGMLKASFEGLAGSLARVILIQPSLKRIETFLKMKEAPVLLPDIKPDWVNMWPARGTEARDEAALVVKGSFSWSEGGSAVMHDLDLSVKKGELLAVVGKVGSGKSTLLQVILGELYPDLQKTTLLSRPEVIAYCSQVPHIGEGTLRENVLFGQHYDMARYSEAVQEASLESDLKVLPGGDAVCIGSRGITLSGGQKARVALARAAYHRGSDVVLIDDPFGAVDAPTAMTLLNKLLLGPLLQGRTRVVVLQPDSERLQHFDRVAVLENGRIVEQGPPQAVMQTAAFQALLSTTTRVLDGAAAWSPEECLANPAAQDGDSPNQRRGEDNRAMRVKLREEDFEGRPTLDMVKQWCRIGRWRNIHNTSAMFGIQVFIWLLADLVLANWTNAIAANGNGRGKDDVPDRAYITAYLFWTNIGIGCWVICWKFGMWFTLRISNKILHLMLAKLLRAPVDKFFDKHPIGRIMNRMVADVATVDFSLFLRSTGTIATIYQTLIPLVYLHVVMPWFITLCAVPVYYLIWKLCHRYWNTTVPLRYCATNCRSDVNSLIADVSNNNTVIRAFGDQERITLDMADQLDNMMKASLYGERILRRWLCNRINFLWSFYMSTVYLVGMFNTRWMGAGTLGLCISNLLLIEALLEPNLDHATGSQLEFIALARIHEYMNIPQEKPKTMPGDNKYRGLLFTVQRKALGCLKSVGHGSSTEVIRDGTTLLRASPSGKGLLAAQGAQSLQELCPGSEQLQEVTDWHQVVAVNEAIRDVDLMTSELVGGQGSTVTIEVQSGWLVDGAKVVVENLKAGYADIPRDVLKGINLSFEPKSKVAIAGTTGCGKSSLLLVLLRLLEPRSGRVLLNGVDTRDVGLSTLRRALGLVPQDPVLFAGTLKYNLDPFGVYPDSRIWKAVELTHLTGLVKSWPSKLYFQVAEEGLNLSFGQRQLICLARMVLRQPPLLLLDEATSAIDPRTQEEVQSTLVTAFPNSTLVAVAHRLETILDFDHVCVMEKGEVVEDGPVKEVSQLRGGKLRGMLEAKRSW